MCLSTSEKVGGTTIYRKGGGAVHSKLMKLKLKEGLSVLELDDGTALCTSSVSPLQRQLTASKSPRVSWHAAASITRCGGKVLPLLYLRVARGDCCDACRGCPFRFVGNQNSRVQFRSVKSHQKRRKTGGSVDWPADSESVGLQEIHTCCCCKKPPESHRQKNRRPGCVPRTSTQSTYVHRITAMFGTRIFQKFST